METRYAEPFRLRCCDADCAGHWKLRSMLEYLQEAAGTHAERLGVGFEEMVNRRHLAWVLARLRVRLLRQVVCDENIVLETFPNGFERLFALRQFIGRDAAGTVFLEGSSQWLAVSLEHHRPERPAHAGFDFACEDTPAFFPELGKIAVPETARELFSVTVGASRLDLNGHMNNGEYAALVQDALGVLYGEEAPAVAELQLNFLAEQKLGAQLRVIGETAGYRFSVAGTDETGGTAFQAEGRVCGK